MILVEERKKIKKIPFSISGRQLEYPDDRVILKDEYLKEAVIKYSKAIQKFSRKYGN